MLAKHSKYSEAGVFGAILHWQMLILFFTSAISNIGLPMLSNLRAGAEFDKVPEVPSHQLRADNSSCHRRSSGGGRMRAADHAHVLPGSEHGATGLVLISFAAVLSAINTPVGHALWSLDATISAVLLALLRGGALVLAAYALADKGATGLAGAYVIMGVIQTAATVPFMMWLLRRRLTSVAAREEVAVA